MKRAAFIAICVLLSAGPAWAQSCPPGITIGDCISGLLYGNTSNPRDGTGPGVEPSLSPGPWACIYDEFESCTGNTSAGVSVGDILSGGQSNFANGKDEGPYFGPK